MFPIVNFPLIGINQTLIRTLSMLMPSICSAPVQCSDNSSIAKWKKEGVGISCSVATFQLGDAMWTSILIDIN